MIPRLLVLLSGAVASLCGCATTDERPRTEDSARLLAPLPACLMQLTARPRAGAAVSLREEQYWKLVYPSFDLTRKTLPAHARACTGGNVLDDPLLAGGAPLRAPDGSVEEGDVVVAGGADRLRVVWLRTRKFDDGTAGGTLALVRGNGAAAEVYAVAPFRGRPTRSRFSLERIGPEVVVVAQDDGCTGRAAGTPCETTLSVFLPRQGALRRLATTPVERVAYMEGSEPGVRGRIEYRLASTPQFLPGGVRVLEQVVVRDTQGRLIRGAELDRSYALMPDDTMVVSDESIWGRLVQARSAAAEPAADAPAPK